MGQGEAAAPPIAAVWRERPRSHCEGLWTAGKDRDATSFELAGVGFVLAAREHVDFVRHDDVAEAGEREKLPPLCIQQSTGYSAAPEFDVVFRVLGDFAVYEDVADLDSPARLQHTSHLAKDSGLVGAEVDHTVADDDISDAIGNRQ